VVPELVVKPSEPEGYMSVNYIGLIPVLVKAIQEQQEIIEKQQEQINQLISNNLTDSSLPSWISAMRDSFPVQNPVLA